MAELIDFPHIIFPTDCSNESLKYLMDLGLYPVVKKCEHVFILYYSDYYIHISGPYECADITVLKDIDSDWIRNHKLPISRDDLC